MIFEKFYALHFELYQKEEWRTRTKFASR